MKKILSLALFALVGMSAIAKDIHTIVLTTEPQMHCQGCENRITEQLRYVKGVKNIKASAAEQTVVVTVDVDKSNAQALVASLQKIGYTATVKSDNPTPRADKPVQPKPKHEKMAKGATATCSEGASCCEK